MNANLSAMPDGIKTPSYDRTKLTPGMIHIGLGNFHRAHQAWYLHRLMEQGLAHDWAILGAGVRPGDAAMRDRLMEQDCLTTLIELDPKGTSAEIIGPMIGFIPVAETNAPLIEAMADPAIRVVSLTITEGGYFLDGEGGFDADNPDVLFDAANPETPRTAFGAMIAALKIRRDNGDGPFTGQSCDNLQGNGDVMRQTILGLARLSDPDLAQWIDDNMTFPNAMVDCIVPATGEAELELSRSLGIDDAAPVTHENFRQWVIEDTFCAGRPPWEKAGATLTNDVHDHEAMKIRMLNGGHQVLANAGELLGVPTISACMENPLITAFFRKVESEEIAPYVHANSDFTPAEYLKLIEGRFANPEILDTTRRVAFDGSSRHSGFIVPTIRDALDADGSINGLALTEALWARMCAGVREDGSVIEPNDPFWDTLVQAAEATKRDPNVWLEQTQYYGDLASEIRFGEAFAYWMARIWAEGTKGAIEAYLRGDGA